MSRPTEFEDLVTTSATVSRKQLQEAKDRGLNISELLRDALTSALKTPIKRAKSKNIAAQIKKKIKGVPVALMSRKLGMVALNPSVAARHANSINVRCGTSITGEDLMALVPRY